MNYSVEYRVVLTISSPDGLIDTTEIREEIDSAIHRQWKQSGLAADGDLSEVKDFLISHVATKPL